MTSRQEFIESQGATCANWQWSWSFVNHNQKFVIFGLWDRHTKGLILDEKWKGNGLKQSLEHVRLIEKEGYALKVFLMKGKETEGGKQKIKSISPVLYDRCLIGARGRWYAVERLDSGQTVIPEEVLQPNAYLEGTTVIVEVNAYERNSKARAACIDHYGVACFVCGFDFKQNYGDLGAGYIHVHHEIPLATIKKEYVVDPVRDLKPLCPNCHAMVHRKDPPISTDGLIELLNKRNNSVE